MEKSKLILSKQYLYRWFHGQSTTDDQTRAFLGYLEWKPQHDAILRGQRPTAEGEKIHVNYHVDIDPMMPNEVREVASLFLTKEMDDWRKKNPKYAALTEDELWRKFNSFYLTFLINRNPAAAVCYAAQLPEDLEGRQKRFEEYEAPAEAEPVEDPAFVPMARSWLLEAGWEWQAIRMLLEQVADAGLSTALAFELLVRLLERTDHLPTERERLDAFARDMLRRRAATKAYLSKVLHLSTDQLRRAELRGDDLHTADHLAKANNELETLILELSREADRFDPALRS
jgi:hypothetical protein